MKLIITGIPRDREIYKSEAEKYNFPVFRTSDEAYPHIMALIRANLGQKGGKLAI